MKKRENYQSNAEDFQSPVSFSPAFFMANRHLQTLYPTIFRRVDPHPLLWENFELDDGDFVECVWYRSKPREPRPIVVLFHGLEGSVASGYIGGMMEALGSAGLGVVLMHFRGCGRHPNRLARAYHSGDTSDARAWILELRRRYPESPLLAVGFSVGGNVLLKLLGEWGSEAPLQGAAAVSVPMDLAISAATIERGLARIYGAYLLTPLKRRLLEKFRRFDMESILGVTEERIRRIRSVREFDALYTAPIHGFSSVEAYYREASSRSYLGRIGVPTLILHALDDPFMTPQVLPDPEELSKETILELSPRGGHVGFVADTPWRPQYWAQECIRGFLLERV